MLTRDWTVLELTVNNHPGVMAHVVGLFSRRAYNLESIVVLPIGTGRRSRIWLWVSEDRKLAQILAQVRKLQDVRTARLHSAGPGMMTGLKRMFGEKLSA